MQSTLCTKGEERERNEKYLKITNIVLQRNILQKLTNLNKGFFNQSSLHVFNFTSSALLFHSHNASSSFRASFDSVIILQSLEDKNDYIKERSQAMIL